MTINDIFSIAICVGIGLFAAFSAYVIIAGEREDGRKKRAPHHAKGKV